MREKLYSGIRRANGPSVAVLFEGNGPRHLNPRNDLANHSPDGFEWGYAGSGPAQLALAILADATGDDSFALAHYQAFKSDIIAVLPREDFHINVSTVHTWVNAKR